MAKKDSLKAKITFLNSIIITILTTIFALLGFIALNYKSQDKILMIFSYSGLVVLIILFFCFVLSINKLFHQIEKED